MFFLVNAKISAAAILWNSIAANTVLSGSFSSISGIHTVVLSTFGLVGSGVRMPVIGVGMRLASAALAREKLRVLVVMFITRKGSGADEVAIDDAFDAVRLASVGWMLEELAIGCERSKAVS